MTEGVFSLHPGRPVRTPPRVDSPSREWSAASRLWTAVTKEGTMALRITVDLFSGRPNPVIRLDDQAAAEVLERLRPVGRLEARDAGPPPESILGYRGLILEQIGRRAEKLPERFRVVDGQLLGRRLAHRPADPNVEDFICGS